ncbi:AAA family ATPase [Mycoplasmatota bacterium WC30]
MEKILIIGCPGSGKSTCSKILSKLLNYPILHLDRIFHIDNYHQITREELKNKILQFQNQNEKYIIDGNYTGTLELRLESADTLIYLDIDSEICLNNVIERIKNNEPRDDIVPGFDNSIMDLEFIEYVKKFAINVKPRIEIIIKNSNVKVIRINNYKELEDFYSSFKK